MSDTTKPDLSGVAETLLITLYIRAMESQRPDALIKDERAEALVHQLDQETLRKTLALTDDFSRVAVILKGREFDRFAQDFLTRHPDAVVVHIGCGLDTRFERTCAEQADNSQVEWYDLDLPDVIELRRRLIDGEGERHHLLACSVLESAWLETVSVHRSRPFLFLAEGVFMYFREAQVKSLVLTLRDRFPGAELVFDGYSPTHVWLHNFQTGTLGGLARTQWGIWHGEKLEKWGAASRSGAASRTGAGIHLLDEWGITDRAERRMARIRWWLRPLDTLFRTMRIYHFRLG